LANSFTAIGGVSEEQFFFKERNRIQRRGKDTQGQAAGRRTAAEPLTLFGWLAGCQPAVLFSHIISASVTSHQPANSIFLSQQISISHQPSVSRTRYLS
jgi:hypothetical protein